MTGTRCAAGVRRGCLTAAPPEGNSAATNVPRTGPRSIWSVVGWTSSAGVHRSCAEACPSPRTWSQLPL